MGRIVLLQHQQTVCRRWGRDMPEAWSRRLKTKRAGGACYQLWKCWTKSLYWDMYRIYPTERPIYAGIDDLYSENSTIGRVRIIRVDLGFSKHTDTDTVLSKRQSKEEKEEN